MKKRFWALFLVFAMLLTMLPVDAFHANTPALKFYWCKQSNGVFETDANGNYLPDIKEEEAVYSHQIPIDHSSPVFFYYEDETGTETAVDITRLQPSNPSLITLRPQNGCVVIEVSDNAKGNENLYIEYRDLNGTLIAQMPVRIDPIPGPALVYRPSINDKTGPVEDTGAAYRSRYSHDVGGSAGLFFYYVDENNTYSKVDPSQLIVGDTTIISKQSVNGAAHLEFLTEGYTDISYVANGVTYSVGIMSNGTMPGPGTGPVVVPNVYFYTDIAGTTMIDPMTGFTVTDTVDTFYFIPKDNWTLTNVELLGDLANIATLTWDTSMSYATIKVTGNPVEGMAYSIRYSATNGTEFTNDEIRNIFLYKKMPGLFFRACKTDMNANKVLDDNGNYVPDMMQMTQKSFSLPANSTASVFFIWMIIMELRCRYLLLIYQ